MSLIGIEFFGAVFANDLGLILGIGSSRPDTDKSFRIREHFSTRLDRGANHIAFLPAFFYRLGGVSMRFSGVEMATENVRCVRSVSAVSQFDKNDILFDFFVPDNVGTLRNGDLFQ